MCNCYAPQNDGAAHPIMLFFNLKQSVYINMIINMMQLAWVICIIFIMLINFHVKPIIKKVMLDFPNAPQNANSIS